MKTKILKSFSLLILLLVLSFCNEKTQPLIPPVNLGNGVNVVQTTGNYTVALATTDAGEYNVTTNVNFNKDSVFVTLTVTLYKKGEASVIFKNSDKSKTYTLNSNQTIANELLGFKPTTANVIIKKGYSATVALAAVNK